MGMQLAPGAVMIRHTHMLMGDAVMSAAAAAAAAGLWEIGASSSDPVARLTRPCTRVQKKR